MSSDFRNYNRLQPSALPLLLRFEKNSKHFIFSIAFLYHVSEKYRPFDLAVRRSLSPPLSGVASTPVPGVLSAGPDFSFFGFLLRPVSSIPLSFRRLTLRCSAVVQILRSPAVISVFLLLSACVKTTLSQGPGLEDRRPPQVFKDPLAYDYITVSSTWELTSVAMRYSQGDGVHTPLS